MSEKRLSRLQKWILTEAYKKGKRDFFIRDEYYISKRDIYHDYWKDFFFELPRPKKWRCGESIKIKPNEWRAGPVVTLSRSLKNLEQKGFIKMGSRFGREPGGRWGDAILTEKGIEKAKTLLSMKINIKNSISWKLNKILVLASYYSEEELREIERTLNVKVLQD